MQDSTLQTTFDLDGFLQKYPPAFLLVTFLTAAIFTILVIAILQNLSVSLPRWRPHWPTLSWHTSAADKVKYDSRPAASSSSSKSKKQKKKVRFKLRESPRLKRQPPP
ncbi:hypothetical protein ABW21_db0209370 [Orbilia brochopaga]|nr:hypothetical protein ABW21_db0209370 [Drechslerella brochopaga]